MQERGEVLLGVEERQRERQAAVEGTQAEEGLWTVGTQQS